VLGERPAEAVAVSGHRVEAGRLWDVLTMLRWAVRGTLGSAPEVRFGVHVCDGDRGDGAGSPSRLGVNPSQNL
jgi:hypothetical protein